MNNKGDKSLVKLGVVLTVSVCICLVFAEILKRWDGVMSVIGQIFSALTPFIIGLVIAFLINPIMIYLRRVMAYLSSKYIKRVNYDDAFRKSKVPALILTIILFIAVLVGFLWLVIPRIYESLSNLVNDIPGYVNDARVWMEGLFKGNSGIEDKLSNGLGYFEEEFLVFLQDKIIPNMDDIVIKISSGVIVGLKAILNFLIGLIVAIYLLASKDVLLAQGKKIIYCIFSKKNGNKILDGLSYANSVFGGFINGKILDSLIIGLMCFAFTYAVGMQYAVLISVIVGVTNVIPFFGPFIGAVPGALLALMDDPMMFAIFIVFVLLLQQFDGNILGPLILGDSTGLSGMWVLVAILLGGDLFGIPGMILGVPVFACIYAFIAVQLRDGLREKNLSSNTEDYFRLKGFDEETGEPIYRRKHDYSRKSVKKKKRKSIFKRIASRFKKAKDVSEAMLEDGGDVANEESESNE